MKGDLVEERAIKLAQYIIDSKDTVRGAAKKYGISKSTVHKDVSERLLKINPDYDKVLEGNLIALEVGINSMLDRCPRFREWVEILVAEVKK